MFLPGMEPAVIKRGADSIRKLAAEVGREPDSIKLIAGIIIIVDETDEKAQAKYDDYLSYADDDGTLALFGGWYGVDLSKWGDDEDFRFAPGFPGAVQGMLEAWSATVPGGQNIKWTKPRIAKELALGGPHIKAIGSPTTVANVLQNLIEETGIDGFNISYAISPGNFEDIIKYLFPELRRRGVFWDDYAVPGGTARENYSGDGKGPRARDDHPASRYRWNAGEDSPQYAKEEPVIVNGKTSAGSGPRE
jgi:alkanesulfonate monooxygenase SsuD/methylene tetrahydromethanopterin reductase-like flavin-dependent oxidoreductase (luciferase family)